MPAARLRAPDAKPVVLVVEDHDDTRFLLKWLLGMRGLDVVEAENGDEAVRLAAGTRPDLILMDASLPLLDGLSATRRIRAQAASAGVPIVFLSGHAEPSFRVAALAAGCDDFLIKPLDIERLDAVLAKHIAAGGRLRPS